jgi:hypothetical protein
MAFIAASAWKRSAMAIDAPVPLAFANGGTFPTRPIEVES